MEHLGLLRVFVVGTAVGVGAALLGTACSPAEDQAEDLPHTDMAATMPAPPDTTGASVWAHLQQVNYAANWNLWPGKPRLYQGGEPHGMLLTTYLNERAMTALNQHSGRMPAGAVIVKENYAPDSTLAAVTVMYKVPGYNAEHGDWFFSKHLPSGALDRMPNGMAMEGRLPGCQNCHMGVRANDYIFTSPLSSGGS